MGTRRISLAAGQRISVRGRPATGQKYTDITPPIILDPNEQVVIEHAIQTVPEPEPEPEPEPPPPGNSVTLAPTATASQLLAAVADTSLDTILLKPGTYRLGQMSISTARTRPVTIKPESSGVIFDGRGVDGHAFHLACANVHFDSLTFENYLIGERGLFTVVAARDISINRITFRNSTGVSPNRSWALYLTSPGARNVTANDWIVTGTGRNFSGLQSMHDPNAQGGQFMRWKVDSLAFAVFLASDATGLEVGDWHITNTGSAHDDGTYSVVAVAGAHISNMTRVNSAGCYIYPPATGSCEPASTGNTRTFGPSVTATQLASAIADNTLDTILLQPGTYRVGGLSVKTARTKMVTIRPESGAVVFDGSGQRVFVHFEGAANVTVKGVKITKYTPTGTGVVVFTNGAHHIVFDGVEMSGNVCPDDNDHLYYPAGYSAACHDLVIRNGIIDGARGGGVHLYHAPPGPPYANTTVLVENNDIRNCRWGIINAIEGGLVTAKGNRFSNNGPASYNANMLAYAQAPYNAKIIASGNTPSDAVTTSGW